MSSTTVGQPNEIFANVVVDDVSCFGLSDGSAIVNPTGGSGIYNVQWPDGSVNFGISNLSVGVYFVNVFDNTGCAPTNNPTSFTVNQPQILSTQTSVVSMPSCNSSSDGEVTVSVLGGEPNYFYEWTNLNGTIISQSVSANNVSQGTYFVKVTDNNNCVIYDTVTLGAPSQISANLSVNSTLCYGSSDGSASVNPSGGTPPYSFIWSGGNGSTTNSMSGLNANTTYYVQITDNNGCSELPTPVTVPQPTVVNITDSIISTDCFNGANGELYITSTFGGTSPYTYLWSNGNTGLFDTTLSAGNYTITVTDSNNCDFDFVSNVTQPLNLIVESFVNLPITCYGGSDGSVYANATGGTIPYTYSWNSTNPINNTNIPNLFNLSSGTYYVTVTDNNGCQDYSNITINDPDSITIILNTSNYNGSNISCNGLFDGSINANVTGGSTPYTYIWDFGSVSNSVSGLGIGTYSVIVTDSAGCTENESVTLTEPDLINLSTTSVDALCYDSLNGSATVNTIGGTSPYSYLWSDGQITQTSTGLLSDNYSVLVTDVNGCTESDVVFVDQPNAIDPEITILTDFNGFNVQCVDSSNAEVSISVSGGNGNQYLYSTDMNFTNITPISIFDDIGVGTFYIYVRDINGCLGSDSVYITGPNEIIPNLTHSNVTCYGGSNGSST